MQSHNPVLHRHGSFAEGPLSSYGVTDSAMDQLNSHYQQQFMLIEDNNINDGCQDREQQQSSNAQRAHLEKGASGNVSEEQGDRRVSGIYNDD